MIEYNSIAESNNFIILEKYTREWQVSESYQSEGGLERELITDLQNQGYEYRPDLNSQLTLLANVRTQLQALNNVQFSHGEWLRFVETYLDKPSEDIVDKTRKIHDDYIHDFVFDDGRIQNIYLLDKKNPTRNKLQVIKQFEQTGSHANRYDVTILVNGLPLVQVAIREAFNQVHRYSKESFNSQNSLFKFLQLFVISNGTDTLHFANTTRRDKNSSDFTMNWAKADNSLIKDLKDFTATFFQKNTLLEVLLKYSVFDVSDTLLVMRPYQIAATERILWKINSSFLAKTWSKPESGGYVWHTTGSGKTLTSFKAARLATELEFVDKVFFVVDRKDLDYQTMKEYQRFSPDSVNGSDSTAGLKRNLEKDDNKIIVTTIQKLNNLMKSEADLPIYGKHVVFIFDECHRSQFGEAQRNLKKKFKKFYQFGFTGTPIFPQNAWGAETTASVFGRELHSCVITDAIRDEKVLKFKVDYNDVRPQFKAIESEQDEKKLTAAENRQALLHPSRIREISQYILTHYRTKTHRLRGTGTGFNAMFAVSSVDAAKLYYESLNKLQADSDRPLRIATIFSFAANEEQDAVGDIQDEGFDVSAMNSTAKEFLNAAIADYNACFKTSFSVESNGFENYYRDLARRVKGTDNQGVKLKPEEKVDLLIVVGMFLTGFDAPTLNTLFVDKNLRYHGLIQAQDIDAEDPAQVEAFKAEHHLSDEDVATLQSITLPADSKIQDYRSTYNDIRDWLRREKAGQEKDESEVDWADVVFEVDLLKSQEINLDYILELIFEHNKKTKNKANLVEEVRRLLRASVGNRAQESRVVDFINQANLDQIPDKASVIEAFFNFVRSEQQREAGELIADENLNTEAAKRYISNSLKREFASDSGTELNSILPKMSPLNPQYLTKKQSVFQKIAAFVEKFKGVGGEV